MEDVTTLRKYLGAMEPGDLLRLDDELRELVAHPGWAKLTALLDVHVTSIGHRTLATSLNVTALAGSLDDLIAREQTRAVAAGTVRGIKHVEETIRAVNNLADETRNALEAKD